MLKTSAARFASAVCVVIATAAPFATAAEAQGPGRRVDFELRALMNEIRHRSSDSIAAIDEPRFTGADTAETFLTPGEGVIGVTLGAEARAYPIAFLDGREVVNDQLNGRPIAVTW